MAAIHLCRTNSGDPMSRTASQSRSAARSTSALASLARGCGGNPSISSRSRLSLMARRSSAGPCRPITARPARAMVAYRVAMLSAASSRRSANSNAFRSSFAADRCWPSASARSARPAYPVLRRGLLQPSLVRRMLIGGVAHHGRRTALQHLVGEAVQPGDIAGRCFACRHRTEATTWKKGRLNSLSSVCVCQVFSSQAVHPHARGEPDGDQHIGGHGAPHLGGAKRCPVEQAQAHRSTVLESRA